MAVDRGPWLSTATALFLSWALLSLSVRLWVKLSRKQKWTHSDTAVSAAFLVALIHVASTLWAIHRGYGKPRADIEDSQIGNVEGALFTAQITYLVTLGLTRVSTAFFTSHLTRHRPQLRMSYALASLSGLWTFASVLVIALRGNLSHPWTTLDGVQALFVRWIAIEATGLVLEIALWAMSFVLIGGLHMKLQKRVMILGGFGCRLAIIPIIGVRLYYLAPAQNKQPTTSNILAGILTEAAMEYALIATSITALKPFLQPFAEGAIVNSVGGTGSGLRYGGQTKGQQSLYMLSSVANKEHRDNSRTATTVESQNGREKGESPRRFRTNRNQSGGNNEIHKDDIESVGSAGSEQMIIKTTRDWSVRYEDR